MQSPSSIVFNIPLSTSLRGEKEYRLEELSDEPKGRNQPNTDSREKDRPSSAHTTACHEALVRGIHWFDRLFDPQFSTRWGRLPNLPKEAEVDFAGTSATTCASASSRRPQPHCIVVHGCLRANNENSDHLSQGPGMCRVQEAEDSMRL